MVATVAGVGTKRIFLIVFGAVVFVLVEGAVECGIGGNDAVVGPAVVLAAARGSGFKTRSTAA